MRIEVNDTRERLYSDLTEATGYGHKSKALDAAARHYLRMAGNNGVRPGKGKVAELMELAADRGSLTPEEIADVLDTEEYPIEASVTWSVGPDDS